MKTICSVTLLCFSFSIAVASDAVASDKAHQQKMEKVVSYMARTVQHSDTFPQDLVRLTASFVEKEPVKKKSSWFSLGVYHQPFYNSPCGSGQIAQFYYYKPVLESTL